jgi:hypothetical protein
MEKLIGMQKVAGRVKSIYRSIKMGEFRLKK